MDYGSNERLVRLFKKKQKSGEITPLDNEPMLEFHLVLVWRAFTTLSRSRQMGFGVGPIPLTEIKAYFDLVGIEDVESRCYYLDLIQIMDSHWLERVKSNVDHRNSNQSSNPGRNR